ADRAEGTALGLLEPPVPVRVEQEPILEVAAGHETDVTEPAVPDQLRDMLIERIEAEVEVHRVHEAARSRSLDQLSGLRGGHRQRLLADHMPTRREDRQDLPVMQLVRR